MTYSFYKYHGSGNDFILIDGRNIQFEGIEWIQKMCTRHFGIGADGVILLKNKPGYDFEMVYYNADGTLAMCGNGGRCVVHFAHLLGIIGKKCRFLAGSEVYEGVLVNENRVELKLADVNDFEKIGHDFFINTGVPHLVKFVDDLNDIDVVAEGRRIRYLPEFQPEGTNVDFVEILKDGIRVATYERGVENETLSCGTGVTAAAIALSLTGKSPEGNVIHITTKGGSLTVGMKRRDNRFREIWLGGKVELVFTGQWQKS